MGKSIYIRFDWAMKRLLRNKANHAVLEGFMTSLLGEPFTIKEFLESEGNQADDDDKFNRVDILAESSRGELIIFEIQNSHEPTYFHRMLYGVSKTITDYIALGDSYEKVRKVYSVNIVYFELGQGADYVYHGRTTFRGLHAPHDTLMLSQKQAERFFGLDDTRAQSTHEAGDIFPEYYVLRVNDFDRMAVTPLDEWIDFLKTGNIPSDYTAPGLAEARGCLRMDNLTEEQKQAYWHHMDNLVYARSALNSSFDDGLTKGRAEGRAEGNFQARKDIARNLKALGMDTPSIVNATGLTEEDIASI